MGHATPDETRVIDKQVFKIGREVHNDIVISADTVSLDHASIEFRNAHFYLEDLSSTNETNLNGKRIEANKPHKLKNGDAITFDIFNFRFARPDETVVGHTFISSGSEPSGTVIRPKKTTLKPAFCPDHPARRATELCFECCQAVCKQCAYKKNGVIVRKNCATQSADLQLNKRSELKVNYDQKKKDNFTLDTNMEKAPNSNEDIVVCTVFCPPDVESGDSFLLQVFAHLIEKAKKASEMAREFDEDSIRRGFTNLKTEIKRGSQLSFELEIRGVTIYDPVQSLIWNGRTESVAFEVETSENHTLKNLIGKVTVSQSSVPVGHIRFKIRVIDRKNKGFSSNHPEPIGEAKRYKYAFIS